jgi:hypothetical protein
VYARNSSRGEQFNTRLSQDKIIVMEALNRIVSTQEHDDLILTIKGALLSAAGRNGNPTDLKDDTELADLLGEVEQFALLRAFLLAIIQRIQVDNSITINELHECTTVKDVVDLVIGKMH